MTLLRNLPADATPTGDDLVYVVNDPAGTPGNRKVTLAALAASTVFTSLYQTLTGFSESVQDIVAAMVLNGAGLTITYDDTAGTLTVSGTRQEATQRVATPTPDSALERLSRAWTSRATAAVKALWVGDSEVAFAFVNRSFNTALSDVCNEPAQELSGWNASGCNYPGDSIWGVAGAGAVWTTTTPTAVTWTRAGTVVTVTSAGHGLATGMSTTIYASSSVGALPNGGPYVVTVVNANTYTIVGVNAGAASGTANTFDVQAHRGLAGHAVQLIDGKDFTAAATTFDRVTFYWLTPLSVSGAQTFDFYVDGALAPADTGVSAAAAGDHTIAVSAGSHTVTVVSHGVTLFDFVRLEYGGNETAGWQPWHAGHTGYTTADFVNATLAPYLAAYLTAEDFDLVLLETATNDLTDAAYFADMGTLIDNVQAAGDASIALVLPNATFGDTTWAVRRDYARRLADTKGVFLIDLTEAIPDLSAADPFGYTTDGVHYSVMGRAVFGLAVFAALFRGQSFDHRAVDGFGHAYSLAASWRSLTTFAGSPGVARIQDDGQGGMELAFYLNDTDAQPIFRIGSAPNVSINGLRWGPGGAGAIDTNLVRTRPAVLSVNDSIQFGGASGVATGARLATVAALPACTYNNGASGVGATLTGNANGALADIDYVTPVANDRIVVKNQASGFQNGIYKVTTLGTAGTPFVLTRTPGADVAADYLGGIFCLTGGEGTINRNSILVSAPSTVVMGTTVITWAGLNRPNASPADVWLGTNRDRRRYHTDFEELITAIAASGLIPGTSWHVTIGGAGAAPTATQVAATEPGVISLATGGAVATGFIYVRPAVVGFTFSTAKPFRLYARAKTPTVSAVGETFRARIGAYAVLTAAAETDGIYFELPADGSNIKAITVVGSTVTTVDTGLAQNTFNRELEIIYDPVTVTAYFYIGGVQVAAITTNLPNTVALSAAAGINKATGTTTRDLRVDLMAVDVPDARALSPLIP